MLELLSINVSVMHATIADMSKAQIYSAHITMAFRDWRVSNSLLNLCSTTRLTLVKIYTGGVIYFALNCSLASTSAFLPTILKTLGFSKLADMYLRVDGNLTIDIGSARVQLMTVPPYAVAAFVIVLGSWISDRLQSRGMSRVFVEKKKTFVIDSYKFEGIPVAFASLVGGVGYL